MVGRYKIVRALGSGGMGDVLLGIDESLSRRAAVKLLAVKHLENPTVRERFVREARALARLSHPNLITVFEAGHVGENERPYFAMELLEGGDTEKLLDESGPLASGVVALIGAEAAAGLGEAAHAGITHRDVKPANLGISAQGVLKVTDFSLAKSHTMDTTLTARGLVVGTADYIAPEQARGEPIDQRADIYSLGCTLFHLLTGRPPFRALGTEVQRYIEVMRAHVSNPVPDPRHDVATIDEELAELVMICMSKDREHRPTFEELAPALMRIHRRLGGELPRLTRKLFTLPRGSASVPTQPSPPGDSGPTSAPHRHRGVDTASRTVAEGPQARWAADLSITSAQSMPGASLSIPSLTDASLSPPSLHGAPLTNSSLDQIPRHRFPWLTVLALCAVAAAAAFLLLRS
jgi:serine/threonine protein kinase